MNTLTEDPKLTDAQRAALWNLQQGLSVRSGPHLAKLSEYGYVIRSGPNGQYHATQLGIRALEF